MNYDPYITNKSPEKAHFFLIIFNVGKIPHIHTNYPICSMLVSYSSYLPYTLANFVMAPSERSELGAYQTIMGSGVPSPTVALRLGPLSPCKRQAKNYHFAGVPRKKFGVQMTVWTQTPPWTQRKQIFFRFYLRIFNNSFERFGFFW